MINRLADRLADGIILVLIDLAVELEQVTRGLVAAYTSQVGRVWSGTTAPIASELIEAAVRQQHLLGNGILIDLK